MKWLRQTLDNAGFASRSSGAIVFFLIVTGTTLGILVFEVTEIFALSLSVSVGVVGLLLETLNARARSRQATLAALWPEVLDSLISAISSGSSIAESIFELAESGPLQLRGHFRMFTDDIERGLSLVTSLEQLKSRIGTAQSDRLCELFCLVSAAGGAGLVDALKTQVLLVRKELAFDGEISSKVGWITGTAKMAVGAPWLIVAMLSSRPENAIAYASTEGSFLLLIGLLVSIFAYRLVQILGSLPASPRVFA